MSAPLIIDSFAGGGGASTGIEMALGRSPDYAINHNPAALAMHAANHPDTLHLDSNIWEVDPTELVQGRRVGLLWASPDCKHFSKAKGGAPRDRNIRDLAWVIVDWAEKVKPDVILMENVEEFKTWGPLGEDGQPIKEFAGITFELWMKRLKKAGYKLQWRELRACDYGDPTIRKRFFMVARRDGRPIIWPKPSHGDPKSTAVKNGRLLPWRTAAECIDWSLPCPSIFDTSQQIKERHGLRAKRPLAVNTMARVARGMQRYVLGADDPFVVELPDGQTKAPCLATFYGHGGKRGKRAADLQAPLRTITVENRHALVAPHLLSLKNSARRSCSIEKPHPTVLAGGGHSALITPVLMNVANSKTTGRGPNVWDVQEPTRTITGASGLSIIAPVLTYAQHSGRSRDIAEPHHTITASSKDQNAVIAPFLAQHNKARSGHNPGRAINAPISTVTATGSQQGVVAPWFAKYYGTGDGARADAPLHTITVKDRMGHMQADLAAPEFSPEHHTRARQVTAFLRDQGVWDGGEFVTVTIRGAEYVVLDIGMRMLTPRELFNAQGFPRDYVIEGTWHQGGEDWAFKPFTKHQQVSCVGNSVCPGLARSLAAANCAHLVAVHHPEQKEA